MREVAISSYRILTPFTSPWPFSVVDQFLSPSLYKDLTTIMMKDEYFKPVDYSLDNIISPIHREGSYAKKSIQLTNDKNLAQLIRQDVVSHLEDTLPEKYFVIADLVRCDPKYFYNPHKDHKDKYISIVVYLSPEDGDGTILINNEGKGVRVKWRQNRAVVFENSKHGTHCYENTTDKYRYTLNIYITTESGFGFTVVDTY